MEAIVSTKDLKSKLDRKENITVVETFAPEHCREESGLALLAMCSPKSEASTRKGNVRDGDSVTSVRLKRQLRLEN